MKEREALKLSRQLLWRYRHETPIGNQPHMICQEVDEAFERIDEALAQPEQEPVAFKCGDAIVHIKPPVYGVTPPQRTWVGLTDEERVEMWKNYNPLHGMSEFMRQIEAKLKEKNT